MEPVIRDKTNPTAEEDPLNPSVTDHLFADKKEFSEGHSVLNGHKPDIGLRLEFNRTLPGRFDRVIIK
jgi:hypothetical protein